MSDVTISGGFFSTLNVRAQRPTNVRINCRRKAAKYQISSTVYTWARWRSNSEASSPSLPMDSDGNPLSLCRRTCLCFTNLELVFVATNLPISDFAGDISPTPNLPNGRCLQLRMILEGFYLLSRSFKSGTSWLSKRRFSFTEFNQFPLFQDFFLIRTITWFTVTLWTITWFMVALFVIKLKSV